MAVKNRYFVRSRISEKKFREAHDTLS